MAAFFIYQPSSLRLRGPVPILDVLILNVRDTLLNTYFVPFRYLELLPYGEFHLLSAVLCCYIYLQVHGISFPF